MNTTTLTHKMFSATILAVLLSASFMSGVLLWEYMAMANFTGVIP